MIRLFNLVVIGALIVCAVVVYSIKYESMRQAEKVAKLRRAIAAEQVSIAALKAEWAYLGQPGRIGTLAGRHLPLAPMKVDQIVRLADLPDRPVAVDVIGDKLEELGLGTDSIDLKPAHKPTTGKPGSGKSASKPAGKPAKPRPLAALSPAPMPAVAHPAGAKP